MIDADSKKNVKQFFRFFTEPRNWFLKLDKKTKPMTKWLNILLIEDDAIEVMKFNRVIKKLALNHKIIELLFY